MQDSGASVCSIRGDMLPLESAANMDEFRRGASRLLITTDAWRRVITCHTSDVWSGGIDFKRVKVVINYDLPRCRELYAEQAGLTADGLRSVSSRTKRWPRYKSLRGTSPPRCAHIGWFAVAAVGINSMYCAAFIHCYYLKPPRQIQDLPSNFADFI